jgi:Tfp pilus assembly protein PilF
LVVDGGVVMAVPKAGPLAEAKKEFRSASHRLEHARHELEKAAAMMRQRQGEYDEAVRAYRKALGDEAWKDGSERVAGSGRASAGRVR